MTNAIAIHHSLYNPQNYAALPYNPFASNKKSSRLAVNPKPLIPKPFGNMKNNFYIAEQSFVDLSPEHRMRLLGNPGHKTLSISKWHVAILFLLLSFPTLTAQSPPLADSLQVYIDQTVQAEVQRQLNWLYLVFGFVALGLTVWAAVTWFVRIRKVAEELINKKAELIVEKKISDQVGVKAELIRAYFQRIEREEELYDGRILIVNRDRGKRGRGTIESALKEAGFRGPFTFWTLEEFTHQLDLYAVDLILFDNEDGLLQESAIIKVINDLDDGLRYVCYTSKDWTAENYRLFKSKIRFVKELSYLGDALKNALK